MKAIIMAGGEGTRLRCITGEHPKPLVPLLGRPVLEHILLLLRREGFTELCLSLRYRAQEIMDRFGDGSELGLSLRYHVEATPLGTAGGVAACRDFCAGEDVLILSGDAVCDFPLARLMERHRQRDACVTLALCRSDSPLQYGLALPDESGRIRAFVEKPDWSRVVTDLVNTGIYVLSPRALEQIPTGRPYDFAKDLFPLLLGRGELLLGLPVEGYWRDIGSPESYYRCCLDALEGRVRLSPGPGFAAPAPSEAAETGQAEGLLFPCRSRAALMGRLSSLLLELEPDYSDGIRLRGSNYRMRIFPLSDREALCIRAQSRDAEFAGRLEARMRDVVAALEPPSP